MKYVVSACLAGEKCRFDGKSKPHCKVIELVKNAQAVPVCPEILGGLPVPRIACEQREGEVVSKYGKNMTKYFEKGANEALKIALENECTHAILKSRSPSCGFGKIYDGSFCNILIKGNGIFAKILENKGFEIITEEDLE